MEGFWPNERKVVRVEILTVDPRTRLVEARLKDDIPITLAVWETPLLFRWPREGESWTAIYENNFWRLGEYAGPNPDLETLLPGEGAVDADRIYFNGEIFVLGSKVVRDDDERFTGIVHDDDNRLSDSRIPTGPAGGILAGTYPNPTFASPIATEGALEAHTDLTVDAHGGIVADSDSRLTDSRIPTGAAGGVLSGNYPNPVFAVDMVTQAELDSHTGLTISAHGGIVADTDTRLTDSRTPNGLAGGVLSGTYPNPSFAVDMATQSELDTSVTSVTNSITNHTNLTTTAHGGIVTNTDSRLSDSRTPIGDAGGVLSGIYPNPTFAIDMATQAELDASVATTTTALSNKADLVSGLIPTSQIPSQALVSITPVASEAEQIALNAQEGDVAVRSDINQTFMHNGGTSGTIADWTLLDSPTDAVTSVNSQTGTVILGKTDIGLNNVDNTSDINKPVSTAQATANTSDRDRANHTGTQLLSTISDITATASEMNILDGISSTTTELNYVAGVTSSIQTQLNAKASNSAFNAHTSDTTNPHSVTKTQVGLGNADNTSDADKPISTAQQTALDLKSPLASPTFTGIPTVPTPAAGTNTTQIATTAFVTSTNISLYSHRNFTQSGTDNNYEKLPNSDPCQVTVPVTGVYDIWCKGTGQEQLGQNIAGDVYLGIFADSSEITQDTDSWEKVQGVYDKWLLINTTRQTLTAGTVVQPRGKGSSSSWANLYWRSSDIRIQWVGPS